MPIRHIKRIRGPVKLTCWMVKTSSERKNLTPEVKISEGEQDAFHGCSDRKDTV